MSKGEVESRFYKLHRAGGTRALSVGKFIPADWSVVRVVLEDSLERDDRRWVRLRVERVA